MINNPPTYDMSGEGQEVMGMAQEFCLPHTLDGRKLQLHRVFDMRKPGCSPSGQNVVQNSQCCSHAAIRE